MFKRVIKESSNLCEIVRIWKWNKPLNKIYWEPNIQSFNWYFIFDATNLFDVVLLSIGLLKADCFIFFLNVG